MRSLSKFCTPTAEKLQKKLAGYLEQSINHFSILSHDKIALIQPTEELQSLLGTKGLRNYSSLFITFEFTGLKVAIGSEVENNRNISLSFQTTLSTLRYGETYFPKKSIYFFNQYKLPALLDNLHGTWQSKELLKPIDTLYQQDENHLLQEACCNGIFFKL